ncbi:sigma-70 family RNA polymerase sigma factor [Fontivita pretiosa]|uniref:sigma-70 family RNA polymerase sigma factor n=1 Tax=Fontivita pretiosa TaxID=2989684 RepID=UPI003D175926
MSSAPDPADTLSTRSSMFARLVHGERQVREHAWTEFKNRYAPIIERFARQLGVRSSDCDDIVQDVLVGFVSSSQTFRYDRSRGRFRGFLKACARSALIKRVGQNARFQGVPLENLDPDDPALARTWDDIWDTEHLRLALTQIKRQFRGEPKTFRAFELYVLHERDADEVARELGISVNSVHQAKTRIARLLKQRLRELEEAQS